MEGNLSYFIRLSSIIEAMPDALVIVDMGGRISLINRQTEALFGYERTELLGEMVESLMPQRFRGNHSHYRTDYFKGPRVRAMGQGLELFGLKKDGIEFPIEISLSPLKTEEGVFALAAVRDITDRKNIENVLKEKNVELERANLAKDKFLANMSHELRTPLNAIIGFTGTLLMKLPGPLNEEQEKQLQTIKRGSQHLLSLINDLLDLAKIEAGKVEIHLEPVDCLREVNEIVSSLLPSAVAKGLRLTVKSSFEKSIVNTDRRALSQIIINLINNAIKYTDSGSVDVQLEKKKIQKKEAIIIHVIDTGRGIKTEEQTKLFEAFEQLSLDSHKPSEGAGLGLHVSQKLAKLLNGSIDFASDYGKGSRFSLILPILTEGK